MTGINAGCGEFFSEQVSVLGRVTGSRRLCGPSAEWDTLAVTKPDSLARSTADLLSIVEDLDRRGVGCRPGHAQHGRPEDWRRDFQEMIWIAGSSV